VSQVQIKRCKARFSDPVAADRFEKALQRADALVYEAAQLRRGAWASYRAAILQPKRSEEIIEGQYA
jgi:hypothetical protein